MNKLPDKRMISLRGLTAGYGEKTAFENLYLDFIGDQASVLLGPGNSGKSTILKLLSKTFMEHEEAWYNGTIYFPWPSFGYVSQKTLSDKTLTLRKLIRLSNKRISKPERQIRLCWKNYTLQEKILQNCIDEPLIDQPASIQRMAYVTASLVKNTEVILLDEPEVGMNHDELTALIGVLNRYKKKRTIILVTHHLRLAREVGDFITLMAYGRIIESKNCETFFTAPSHPYSRSVIETGC